MDKALYNDDTFKDDSLRAVDAKFEAQKIAFSPLTFQAVRALIETGLLQMIEDAGYESISRSQLAEK